MCTRGRSGQPEQRSHRLGRGELASTSGPLRKKYAMRRETRMWKKTEQNGTLSDESLAALSPAVDESLLRGVLERREFAGGFSHADSATRAIMPILRKPESVHTLNPSSTAGVIGLTHSSAHRSTKRGGRRK